MGVMTGLQFPLTGAVTSVITRGEIRRLSNTEMVTSGFLGGAISGIACGPMELVLIQQQRKGTSLGTTLKNIVSKHGWGGNGLFRGVLTASGREAIYTAGYLGVGPAASRYLMEEGGMSEGTAKMAGAIGTGVLAASLSHPLDTIKTCMQGDIEQKTYRNLRETARTIYADGGFAAFLRGFTWRTGRMILAVFIMGECKNQLSPLFFPHHFVE